MSVPQAIEGGSDDRPHKCVLKAAGSSSPIFFNAEISTFEIQNPHYAIAFSFTNQLFIRANQPTGTYCSLIAISVRVIRSSPTNPEGNNNLQNEKKESLLHNSIACRGIPVYTDTKGHVKVSPSAFIASV